MLSRPLKWISTFRPMSALGHKQTFAAQNSMSALPPIATAKADSRNPSCLLYPQKRTCAVHLLRSASGQKRTLTVITSLDHLVGLEKDRSGNFNAKCPRHFQVYHEVELGGLLNW